MLINRFVPRPLSGRKCKCHAAHDANGLSIPEQLLLLPRCAAQCSESQWIGYLSEKAKQVIGQFLYQTSPSWPAAVNLKIAKTWGNSSSSLVTDCTTAYRIETWKSEYDCYFLLLQRSVKEIVCCHEMPHDPKGFAKISWRCLQNIASNSDTPVILPTRTMKFNAKFRHFPHNSGIYHSCVGHHSFWLMNLSNKGINCRCRAKL